MLLHREKEGRNTLRPSHLLLYFAFHLISLPFSPSSLQQENNQFYNTDLPSQNRHDPMRFPQSASLSPFLLVCHYRNRRRVSLPGAEIPTSRKSVCCVSHRDLIPFDSYDTSLPLTVPLVAQLVFPGTFLILISFFWWFASLPTAFSFQLILSIYYHDPPFPKQKKTPKRHETFKCLSYSPCTGPLIKAIANSLSSGSGRNKPSDILQKNVKSISPPDYHNI